MFRWMVVQVHCTSACARGCIMLDRADGRTGGGQRFCCNARACHLSRRETVRRCLNEVDTWRTTNRVGVGVDDKQVVRLGLGKEGGSRASEWMKGLTGLELSMTGCTSTALNSTTSIVLLSCFRVPLTLPSTTIIPLNPTGNTIH